MAKQGKAAVPAGTPPRPKRARKAKAAAEAAVSVAQAVATGEMSPEQAVKVAEAVVAGIQAESPRKPGQPTKRTDAIIDEILERISEGEPLRAICRDEHMPHWRTIYCWTSADEDLAKRLAAARELGEDALAEQCLVIADDERHDWRLTKKGILVDDVAIGRAKLQIDTRLKLLAKWNPRKYGDSVQLKHSGGVGVIPLEVEPEHARRVAQALLDGMAPLPEDGETR